MQVTLRECQLKPTNAIGKHHSYCDDYRPLAIKVPLTLRHHVFLKIYVSLKVFDNPDLNGIYYIFDRPHHSKL